MQNEMNHAHQDHIFTPLCARKVTLIGVGSVGSHVAYHLAKMGVRELEVWDDDGVASHNVSLSLYGPEDVGAVKVHALQSIIHRLTGLTIAIRPKKYEGEPLRNTTVVACVDTMDARKKIWNVAKDSITVDLFCDTRTAAAYIEVLTINPHDAEDVERYEKLWFDDRSAARQTCGRHGIVYGSSRAGQIVASNLASFWQHGLKEWRVAERCDTLQRVF